MSLAGSWTQALTRCGSSAATEGTSFGGKRQILLHGCFALSEAFG